MAQKIHHLQSVLFTLKICFPFQLQVFRFQGDSLATDERLNALEEESLKHKMLRIDSKWLPLRLKRSCTDVLNPSMVYGYECVMLLVWCSFCHWLLSLCFQMPDIVTEQWIQIQRLEQALHITQVFSA
ncbi:hypothetical protein PRUPE_1G318200 [Prunus persica]|uniref:Uncharacterized protein n=1 Tax=Prunus persica TaxID=3760 RepID=M5Y975_PRUPE|nr:hypothetical protein PRUPE_1G318200 [Prunus persica]